jgi:hypothetical protein
MANARIYFAPTTKRGIVVGSEIPQDVLETAREEDLRRRENADLLELGEDDLSWLSE